MLRACWASARAAAAARRSRASAKRSLAARHAARLRPRRFFRLAFGRRSFADPHLALVVGLLESRDLSSSSAGSFSSSARSAACCFCRSTAPASRCSASLCALAPFGLLACGGTEALAVGRGLARLGRGFGAFVGDGRRSARAAVARAASTSLLQRCRIGQRGKRALGRSDRFARRFSTGSRSRLTLRQTGCAAPRSLERRGRGIDRPSSLARIAFRGERRVRASSARPGIAPSAASASSRSARAHSRPPAPAPAAPRRAAARRLARSSRSAAAAPAPFATKPSHRRSRHRA